jgi:hypothetical protein
VLAAPNGQLRLAGIVSAFCFSSFLSMIFSDLPSPAEASK